MKEKTYLKWYNKVGYGSVIAIFIFLLCILGSFVINRFDTRENYY